MNSATEQLGIENNEENTSDRRRGMKLVAGTGPKKRQNKVRIDVSDEVFGPEPPRKRPSSPERKYETPSLTPFPAEVTIGIAVLAGLVIGYFVGRRRD